MQIRCLSQLTPHWELALHHVTGRLQKSAQTADVLSPNFQAENRVLKVA